MINRRQFLKSTALLAGIIGGLSSWHCSKKSRPNILWIIADDLSPDLGCYGNTVVHTPHIDALANAGMRFENAFATNPVCSPSRSAIYTGMYQTTIGAHQHRTENRSPLAPSVKMITEYFRQAGYFTVNGHGVPDSQAAKTDFNFIAENPFDGTDWTQRQPGQPFFASVQFHEPHRVFKRDEKQPVPPDQVQLPPYYPDHPVTRRDWANYLETIQILDRRVGQLLQRLEDEGLAENTVVFFFSDQGRPHVRGKQWLYEGGIRVPLIVRWPDKRNQGVVSQKLVSLIDLTPTCLNLAGIVPPAHLPGIDFIRPNAPEREYIIAARDRCDAVVDRIRCVRTKQFKYIRNFYPDRPYSQFGHYKEFNYPVLTLLRVLEKQGRLTPEQGAFLAQQRPAEELYDLKNDPWEVHNLVADVNYQDTLQTLRQTLETWMQETNDQGGNDADDYDALLERRREKYGPRWQERGIDPHKTPPEEYLKWWEKELGLE